MMAAVVTVVHVKRVGCRSCGMFYVNEQIHFHAWLVSGQPVTNGPGASSLSDAKNSSSVIREACTAALHGTESTEMIHTKIHVLPACLHVKAAQINPERASFL